MATAQAILDRAIELGEEKSELAQELVNDAIIASLGSASINPVLPDATPAVVEPPVTIPANATGIDFALFDSTYKKIIDDLSDKYAFFLSEYFPIDGDLMNATVAWLTNAIQNGGSGVNATVEGQLWQRDRDRITIESLAATDEVIGIWAGRGYPLPPGAAVASVQAIARKRTTDLNDQSRDVMVKAWDKEIENVRFAITTAINYRAQAIQAAGDYIRAMALGPQLAAQLATSASDAQARLITAASSYYNARIGVAELAQRRSLAISDLNLSAATTTTQNAVSYSRLRADTAIAGAQSLGQQAAAALNSVSATAQIIEAVA